MRASSFLPACALLLAACGTLRGGRRWGEDATLAPGGERLARAARDALQDPWTWVPLVGAGVLAFGDVDDDIADWAIEHHPLFGSAEHAEDVGHLLRNVAGDAWIVSLLATPSGDEPGPWALSKLEGFVVDSGALFATSEATSLLKGKVRRDRPDGSSNESFPSSGAADTWAYAALARRNLESIDMPAGARVSAQVGLGAVSLLEAWSRLEAGKHHPTDVLVGGALGNFLARFVHDGFLGLPEDVGLAAFVDPDGHSLAISITFRF